MFDDQSAPEPTIESKLPEEDFLFVNRFQDLGSGWGYGDTNIEAIRFTVDADIILGKL